MKRYILALVVVLAFAIAPAIFAPTATADCGGPVGSSCREATPPPALSFYVEAVVRAIRVALP